MKLLLLFGVVLLLASCDRPECTNTNETMNKYQPERKEYKAELIKQMNTIGRNKLSYWIARYEVKNGSEELTAYVQGSGLCAKAAFEVLNTKGLNSFKRAKGGGYAGAELKNVKFSIDSSAGDYKFVMDEVGWIAD